MNERVSKLVRKATINHPNKIRCDELMMCTTRKMVELEMVDHF